MLSCCQEGGCWKSRCQLVGDGDAKDQHDVCEQPIQITPDLRIPKCLDMISAEDVIRRIEMYHQGGAMSQLDSIANSHPQINANGFSPGERAPEPNTAEPRPDEPVPSPGIDTPPEATSIPEHRVLINFRHGLGDAVQLTTVLLHLKKHRPDWLVDVNTLVGKHSAFHGLCNRVYVQDRESPPCCQYQQRFDLEWHESAVSYGDSPSTKAERSLREEFGISPDPALCRYAIQIGTEATSLARSYLERVCQTAPRENGRFPAVLIHYEGNTSAEFKNIPTEVIQRLCDDILEAGFTPIILDWDYRTPLVEANRVDGTARVHCPVVTEPIWRGTGTGDAESLAALIDLSSLMIGVDSGPLHVAGATSTPTLGVWTWHHPLHYFGHAENVTHLIPHSHLEMLHAPRENGEAYFASHYQFQTYRDLEDALRVAVKSRLAPTNETNGLIFTRDYWIREDNGEQDLVVVQDIAEEDSYRIDQIPQPGPVIVDIGGHIGCFSKRIHQRNPNARIFAVECCPENIPVLEKNVGGFATVIPAAVTYEPNVALLNAVFSNCRSTGGSTLISRDELQSRVSARELGTGPAEGTPSEYWADFRAMRTVSLEDLMTEHGFDRIDVLKLDCEGSEFSILGSTPSLDRVGLIVGEYHGKERFQKLVETRFAGWELKILRDGDLGTFWLTNPNGKPHNDLTALDPTRPLASEEFRSRLTAAFAPFDREQLETWLPYYQSLFELAKELQANQVIEIGVRAGYSALSFFLANPKTRLLGIDIDGDERLVNTHGGRKGLWRHARTILKPFDFQLLLADSHNLDQLPEADLIYVDGDHSYQGCLADLNLAQRSTNRILVDDYDSSPSVRQACETFASEHPEFHRRYINNHLTGFLLLERRS